MIIRQQPFSKLPFLYSVTLSLPDSSRVLGEKSFPKKYPHSGHQVFPDRFLFCTRKVELSRSKRPCTTQEKSLASPGHLHLQLRTHYASNRNDVRRQSV